MSSTEEQVGKATALAESSSKLVSLNAKEEQSHQGPDDDDKVTYSCCEWVQDWFFYIFLLAILSLGCFLFLVVVVFVLSVITLGYADWIVGILANNISGYSTPHIVTQISYFMLAVLQSLCIASVLYIEHRLNTQP